MRNRTRTILTAAASAALALTACSPEVEPTPPGLNGDEHVTEPTPAHTEGTYDPGPQTIGPPPDDVEWRVDEDDRAYLADVRTSAPDGLLATDEELVGAAFLVCLVYELNADLGIGADETRAEIHADPDPLLAAVDEAAREHYCPQDGGAA